MDGAYNDKNGLAGYGVSLICDGVPMAFSGPVVRYANESKNLVGELEAALIAAKQALELDCTRLIIIYDCESIETLATGKSTPKSRLSKYYVSEMNEYMKQLNITFSYSKAHSGNEWHNFADRLAREGCGIK